MCAAATKDGNNIAVEFSDIDNTPLVVLRKDTLGALLGGKPKVLEVVNDYITITVPSLSTNDSINAISAERNKVISDIKRLKAVTVQPITAQSKPYTELYKNKLKELHQVLDAFDLILAHVDSK